MINFPSFTLKYLSSFIIRLLGVYIILFFLCFYAHVNESNIITGRADALSNEVAWEGSSHLAKVASIQQMVRKVKPNFFSPYTILKSLLGERESIKLVNIQLADLIEKNKNGLAGINLVEVEVENVDLSEADMHRVNLAGSNLRNIDLRKSNLSRANFEKAVLSYVFFQNADLGHASLKGANLNVSYFKGSNLAWADLRGADLSLAVGLTCEQVKAALIDKKTRFPSYISSGCTKEMCFTVYNKSVCRVIKLH